MNVIVERDVFSAALAGVNARACGKMNIPILQCVLLAAGANTLQISSHWLDACCVVTIPAEVSQIGELAVGADKLAGLVNGFATGSQVAMTATEAGIEIKAGRSRYRLSTLPAVEFPPALTSENPVAFTISADAFLSLLDPAEVAMCTVDSRPHLNGIFVHVGKAGCLAACATDGFQLVRVQSGVKVPAFPGIILPRRQIGDICQKLEKQEVGIEFCDRLFSIRVGERQFTTKLIDGTFPDYDRVIPAETGHEIIVERLDLINALQRLRVLLGDRNIITMKWDDGAPQLTLVPFYDATGAEEVMESSGGEIASGHFMTPADRLAPLLAAMPSQRVKLIYTNGHLPLRIEDPDDPSVLMLIMPTDFSGKTAADHP